MTIKAFIFDCGGVMTDDPDDSVLDKYLHETFLVPEEKLGKEKQLAYRSGKTCIKFWGEYAKTRNTQLPSDWQQRLNALMEQSIRPRKDMYDLIEDLKRLGYKIAMLTNVTPLYDKILKARKIYSPFKECCCMRSCKIGYEKPDPKAYKPILAILEKMQITPGQIVFTDDKQGNVDAGEKLGMHGLTFTNISQFKRDLETKFSIKFQ